MFMENGNPDKEIFLENARDIYRHYKPASTSLLSDEQAV